MVTSVNAHIMRTREAMAEYGLDVLYVRNTSNILWLTGFLGVFDSEPAHLVLITQESILLHSDSRYSAALRTAAQDSEFEIDDAKASFSEVFASFIAQHAHEFSDLSQITVGIEDTILLREWEVLRKDCTYTYRITSNLIEQLRAEKDEAEIESLRQAQAITDEAFTYITTYMKPGMTELEVQRELDRVMFTLGADGLAFDTIVATGAHAASPHAQPTNACLEQGDAVVMDFGAKKNGYCSDMTRTVFMGQPDAELRRAWQALRCANETCEAMISEGIAASEVHAKAEEVLAEFGFEGCMGHPLGHGVGIDIHELPNLSSSNTQDLLQGNVVTVEPGIYIEGKFGMRLEDFGVVTDERFEVFTQSTHEMVIIENC